MSFQQHRILLLSASSAEEAFRVLSSTTWRSLNRKCETKWILKNIDLRHSYEEQYFFLDRCAFGREKEAFWLLFYGPDSSCIDLLQLVPCVWALICSLCRYQGLSLVCHTPSFPSTTLLYKPSFWIFFLIIGGMTKDFKLQTLWKKLVILLLRFWSRPVNCTFHIWVFSMMLQKSIPGCLS